MQDLVIILILLAVVGAAAWYVIKAKRSGKKCIGCPDGCSCSKNCNVKGCECDNR